MSTAVPAGRRLSLEEYEAMASDGRLDPAVAVELLDGILVPKMTKGPRHAAVTRRIQRMIHELLPEGYVAFKEDPVRLPVEAREGGGSEPEPDITVAVGSEANFEAIHPGPGEVLLVVEVAADTRRLRNDRAGLARYARNGIPCVWLVNLPAEVIEVYTQPGAPADEVYERNAVVRTGDTLVLDLGPRGDGGREEIRLAVSDLLA